MFPNTIFLRSRYTPFTVDKDKSLIAVNHPVNLMRCDAIISELYNIYGIDYPCIKFPNTGITWVYQNNENRDDEYKRILDKFSYRIDEI